MTTNQRDIDDLCINTIRTLAMDTVQKANSGHAGTPMGAAAMAYTIWSRFLHHNPADPSWPNRDRFVLSPGHASVLLYSLLALTGYDLKLEELQQFRQWGSRTPGHPEYGHTPGVDLTTGPLGAGFAMGVGFAVAEGFLAENFNRPDLPLVDHYVYGIVSDGDMMEGVSSEAASLAGTLGLGKLIYLYDDNEISIEGDTSIAFTESVARRFDAYGWDVRRADGNDVEEIASAIRAAQVESAKPSLIICRTTIGFGSPNLEGTPEVHGAPLGLEEIRLTKEALGWPVEPPFYVPDEALAEFRKAIDRGNHWQAEWSRVQSAYQVEHPDDSKIWSEVSEGALPDGWEAVLPIFSAQDGPLATRSASGKVMNAVAGVLPTFLGGSADLAPSTKTYLKGHGDLGIDEWCGHNMHFGVREHAMGNIINGMALHGGVIPYGATFFVFSDYLRPALRLAALMQCHSIFVFTHDSIGVGEDGPTHQPIEHLAAVRAIPGLTVIRPADANETVVAWRLAIEAKGPTALVLSRQDLPIIDDVSRVRQGVPRGAYVLSDADSAAPQVILLATGSEVSIALAASEQLASEAIAARVVSMPSWELFEQQPRSYRDQVLPPTLTARVAIEAASSFGWDRWVGAGGEIIALDRFGASAPAEEVYERLGLTPEAVVAAAKRVL